MNGAPGSIIQYNTLVLSRSPNMELPGVAAFRYLSRIFSIGLAPTDRTGSIHWPVKTKLIFPIPAIRPMKKTFEELCNERAHEILVRADSFDSDVCVLWSGGIDSTLVLISLLKNATPSQKKRIVVLMTDESIAEYPKFYEEHVRGKLRAESSMLYPYMLGGNAIMTNGEQNDQLFGFDSVGRLMNRFGPAIIHEPRKRETFFTLFDEAARNPAVTNRLLDLLELVMAKSPIPVETHFDYLWWINFSQKWQNTFLRTLSTVPPRNVQNITPEYVRTRNASFYGTEEFQLWSLHNQDKKIKDEWRTYKWICKDIIYDYTKDANYRDNKTKRGSLHNVIIQQISYDFIDEEYRYYNDLDPQYWYDPKNGFADIVTPQLGQ